MSGLGCPPQNFPPTPANKEERLHYKLKFEGFRIKNEMK